MSQSAPAKPLRQAEVLAAEIELIRRRRREAGLSIMAALRKIKRTRRSDGLAANDGVVDTDPHPHDEPQTALSKTSVDA